MCASSIPIFKLKDSVFDTFNLRIYIHAFRHTFFMGQTTQYRRENQGLRDRVIQRRWRWHMPEVASPALLPAGARSDLAVGASDGVEHSGPGQRAAGR